ncbi:tape measure protein [Enterobacter roggenkampii]|uniref:tape measure protein n=1 Tax=Enterobacter roggenkampii TaxID=1812935 RepID=UPI002FE57AFA
MAGDKQTIESFSIDLLLNSPKFLQQLQSVEKKVNEAAQRMEKRLAGAFNLRNKGAAFVQKDLNRIVKATETAAKQMNRSLTNAFNVRGNNGNFRQWVQNAERSAERVTTAIDRANRRMGANGGARIGGAGSGSSAPRLTSEERLNRQYRNRIARMADNVHAQFYGSTMERLQRGGHTQQVNQFRSQIRDAYLRNRSSGDTTAFRREVREATQAQRMFLNSQRSSASATTRLTGETEGLIGKFSTLAVGLLSAQAALEYFQKSLVEGNARFQSGTMLGAAFGDNAPAITKQVTEYADKFGMNKTEALQQAAILRGTLPDSLFKDSDIPRLMQTESIFGHQTGMTNEQIGRLNYALPQVAASPHLQGNDWMQIANAAPGIVKPLLELTGAKNVADLKKMAQTMSGAEFAQLMIKAMDKLASNAKVASAAMNSMQANLGRYQNAVQDGQVKFFDGYSDGFKALLQSLTGFFNDSNSSLETLGRGAGYIFDNLATMVDNIGVMAIRASGYFNEFKQSADNLFKKLPKGVQGALGDIGDTATQALTAYAAYKTLSVVGSKFLSLFSGTAATVASTETATLAATGALGRLSAFFTGALLPFLGMVELAANADKLIGTANTLREKMGFSDTKGFSERAESPDASWLDKLLGYNPSQMWDWFKDNMKDAPAFQGNWTGATSPAGITPTVPFMPPMLQQLTPNKIDGNIKLTIQDSNGKVMSQGVLNQGNGFSLSLDAASMNNPWQSDTDNYSFDIPQQY